MKPIIPDDLLREVVRGNCVVFIGAGPSVGAGLPTWFQLIRQMADWCEKHGVHLSNKADIEHLISVKKDLLAAADAMQTEMGEDSYRQFMVEVFLRPDLKPTEVHEIVAKIPFVGAATTNYDSLVEESFRQTRPQEPVRVFTQVDYEQLGTALQAKEFFVLKAHGTIERIETIVLGRRDYNRLIHASQGYRTFLRALFINRTVFFLGFSMTDPDLLLLLGELNEIFQGHSPTHFALMDVTSATQTEQEQFLEHYRVNIIPYVPSTDAHLEVKSFLIELNEKVHQQAVWYRIGEARKVIEDEDPNYAVIFTTENKLIVKAKHPDASKVAPLTFKISAEGEDADALRRLLDSGEPLNIRGEHLVNVTVPDLLRRYLPTTDGPFEISTGAARREYKKTVKVTIECADGEIAFLDNVILEDVQSGNKQGILSNENQDVPWKFRIAITFGKIERDFNFTFDDVGLPVKRALEGLRFSRALSKGGFLRFDDAETGKQWSHGDLPAGLMPAPNPLLIRMLEALELIQRKCGVLFTSPVEVPEGMVNNIFVVEQIIQTGKIEPTPPVWVRGDTEQVRDLLKNIHQGLTVKFAEYADDWVFIVLGQHISLGPVLVACEKLTIGTQDQELLMNTIKSNAPPALIEIPLTPAPGEKIEAKLPNWLPIEEAREILNLPLARSTSLKNLIALLLESSKGSNGALDIEEFFALLHDSKGQLSERGLPLSPLSTATSAELLEAFRPELASLSKDEKQRLGRKLVDGGWLSELDAGFIADEDEKTPPEST
ncbi:MAG: SIR2 family protein [Acidobacteria bacterium]|nr:SIR2 family protein [Acidobacteriota bacterium]